MGDGAAHGRAPRATWSRRSRSAPAGGVRNAVDLVRGLVVVLNGDILTDVDLTAMLRFHAERGSRATHLPHPRRRSQPVRARRARGRRARPALRREAAARPRRPRDTINAGIYVLDARAARPRFPTGRAVSIEREFFPGLLARRACRSSAGSPAATGSTSAAPPSTAQAQLDLLAGRVTHRRSRPRARPRDGRCDRAGAARVAPDAAVAAPVRDRRGRRARVGRAGGPARGPRRRLRRRRRRRGSRAPSCGTTSSVGPGAVLRDCIVGAGVRIGADAQRRPRRGPRGRRRRARRHPHVGLRDRPRRPTGRARAWYPEPDGHRSDPQLLHRRPHRPRQVHPGRPAPVPHRDHGRQEGGGPGPRLDGPGEGARHHHQGPHRAPALHGARRAGVHAQPHRHARATWTSPTRSPAPSPPARARS